MPGKGAKDKGPRPKSDAKGKAKGKVWNHRNDTDTKWVKEQCRSCIHYLKKAITHLSQMERDYKTGPEDLWDEYYEKGTRCTETTR